MKKKIVAFISLMILCFSMIPVAMGACSHTYQWRIVTDATCKKEGLRRQICTKCNAKGKEEVIAKHHVYPFFGEYTIRRQPTCQQKGYRDRICSVCGYQDKKDIAKVGHRYTVKVIRKEANCSEEGKMVYKCEWCPMHDNAHPVTISKNPMKHIGFRYVKLEWVREKGKYKYDRYCTGCDAYCGVVYRD